MTDPTPSRRSDSAPALRICCNCRKEIIGGAFTSGGVFWHPEGCTNRLESIKVVEAYGDGVYVPAVAPPLATGARDERVIFQPKTVTDLGVFLLDIERQVRWVRGMLVTEHDRTEAKRHLDTPEMRAALAALAIGAVPDEIADFVHGGVLVREGVNKPSTVNKTEEKSPPASPPSAPPTHPMDETAWVIVRDPASRGLYYWMGRDDGRNWHTAWSPDPTKAKRFRREFDARLELSDGRELGAGAFLPDARVEQHMWVSRPSSAPPSAPPPAAQTLYGSIEEAIRNDPQAHAAFQYGRAESAREVGEARSERDRYRLALEQKRGITYVLQSDYDALAQQLAAATLTATYESDVAQQAVDAMKLADAETSRLRDALTELHAAEDSLKQETSHVTDARTRRLLEARKALRDLAASSTGSPAHG